MMTNIRTGSSGWSLIRNGRIESLPPGLRFQPSDDELAFNFLWRKVYMIELPPVDIIDVDIRRTDPWKLPGHYLQARYFFSRRKPGEENETAVTESGYWRCLVLEEQVESDKYDFNLIAMKRTWNFYEGIPPHGIQTDWIIHEFRIVDPSPRTYDDPIHQEFYWRTDTWVVCRIFPDRIRIEEERAVPLESTSDSSSDSGSSGVTDDEAPGDEEEEEEEEGENKNTDGQKENKREEEEIKGEDDKKEGEKDQEEKESKSAQHHR